MALPQLVFVALLAGAALGCTRTDQQPDVFLVVVDTQRADHLSLYGYDRETSPQLTKFARDAVVYEKAITPGTWTVPAHGALFTGMWPSYHGAERVAGQGVLARAIRPEAATLAELLSSAGYETAAIVGNDAYVAEPFGFARGFDSFRSGDVGDAEHVRRLAAEVLESSRRPLFLFLNILDPHEPYAPPAPFDERFPGRRASFGTELTAIVHKGKSVSSEMLEHFRSQYDGEVAYTDQALEGFLTDLRRSGRYDSALIVITSDHGELLGEHGQAGHGGYPLEPLVHVPLIVKYPDNARAGATVERRVSTLGVFATILEASGVAAPPDAQARRLDEPHEVWVEDIDFTGRRVRVAYRGDQKLIAVGEPEEEAFLHLYDLSQDPGEHRRLRDPSAGEAIRAKLLSFAKNPRPENASKLPVIDGDRQRRLRALGYIR